MRRAQMWKFAINKCRTTSSWSVVWKAEMPSIWNEVSDLVKVEGRNAEHMKKFANLVWKYTHRRLRKFRIETLLRESAFRKHLSRKDLHFRENLLKITKILQFSSRFFLKLYTNFCRNFTVCPENSAKCWSSEENREKMDKFDSSTWVRLEFDKS